MNSFTLCSPKCRASIASRALWELADARKSLESTKAYEGPLRKSTQQSTLNWITGPQSADEWLLGKTARTEQVGRFRLHAGASEACRRLPVAIQMRCTEVIDCFNSCGKVPGF